MKIVINAISCKFPEIEKVLGDKDGFVKVDSAKSINASIERNKDVIYKDVNKIEKKEIIEDKKNVKDNTLNDYDAPIV